MDTSTGYRSEQHVLEPDGSGTKAHLVGGGIASLAAAAYLIKDGGLLGANIAIYEGGTSPGGALDAGSAADKGYSMRGERMFEPHYVCTYDLLSFIPSLDDPTKSVKQDIVEFVDAYHWNNKARLIDKSGTIVDFHKFGFDEQDRLDLVDITAKPEKMFNGKRITDCFSEHFLHSNFWYMWQTTFGFEPWHSAIEMRRYLLRFMHLFSQMPSQEGLYRTRYNQYDSIVRPLHTWLADRGVRFVTKTWVTNIDFSNVEGELTASRIEMTQDGKRIEVAVRPGDLVLVTNGSMVANSSVGANDAAPQLNATTPSPAFALWETLARGRTDFGDPSVFATHIEGSKWESFTVTTRDPLFFQRMEAFSGSKAGRGGLITFKDSSWLLTLSLYHQPQYRDQPTDVFVWWGYGLYPDKIGDYVHKPMEDCTGGEILEEILHHLRFDADRQRILDASIVRPCMMPYITSMFLARKTGDRPDVVPKGSTNFAFLGQFAEVPKDTVFTVEYSVRTAMLAVYKLLKLDKEPPPVVDNTHDIHVLWEALEAMHH
jgi:oleate hydratase